MMLLFVLFISAAFRLDVTLSKATHYQHPIRSVTVVPSSAASSRVFFDGAFSLQPPPKCRSPIYCEGQLLHVVQMSAIFNDSKTFVDLTMRHDEEDVLNNFRRFIKKSGEKPSKEEVKTFVQENFEMQKELDEWTPEDYTASPRFLDEIANGDVRNFAQKIIKLWPQLGRKINPKVLANINRHSLLPLTHGFIVPGGRFRETYYWDTHWIVKGLLLCEMTSTVRGMLDNFVTLIKRHGFIPNGARLYYTERSQPPLFTQMVHAYYSATKDIVWLQENLLFIEKELLFWLENRMTSVKVNSGEYKLARYLPDSLGPRPESYKEDFHTASMFPSDDEKQRVYTDLKGGAESGWDFSTRWLYDAEGSSNTNISHIYTRRTIPVDLNSFLYGAFHDYSSLALLLGHERSGKFWSNEAAKLKGAIKEVLWNEQDGTWYDYDTEGRTHRKAFFVSNVSPLWVGAQHSEFDGAKLLGLLEDRWKIFDFPGGTPSSLHHSGEQWDYPNAWPPLQAIIIQSLANMGTPEAHARASLLAKTWVEANMKGFEEHGFMFEKYNALEPGKRGGGGEYEVQAGFGWTNGVVLELISQYYTKK